MIVEDKADILYGFEEMTRKEKEKAVQEFASYAAEKLCSCRRQMTGSKEYRRLLVEVLTRRAWEAIGGMKVSFWLNGVYRHDEAEPDTILLDFLRDKGCYSVKRGCETANCGLCTVLMDGKPVLLQCSCPSGREKERKS